MLISFFWKQRFSLKNLKKKFFIYFLAGHPVSGKIIGRISGQISIRYNPNQKMFKKRFIGGEGGGNS